MDKSYKDTVALLLDVAPFVFKQECFAMKGGTAINLFCRDMPRLSVDIDLVYINPEMPKRVEALAAIRRQLRANCQRTESQAGGEGPENHFRFRPGNKALCQSWRYSGQN